MGKRDQGRLVHEIRDALLAHGFLPTSVTEIKDADDNLRGIRHPGFTVQKHNDGRSVRVGYRATTPPPVKGYGWVELQAYGEVQMRRLVGFNSVLEEAGFICIQIESRNPVSPYSIWRRGCL